MSDYRALKTLFVFQEKIPVSIRDLVNRMAIDHSTAAYTESVKVFARSLHFHSAAAYRFLRKELRNNLPHPNTLSCWVKHIQCEPGIIEQNVHAVQKKVDDAADKGKKLVFGITFDEISIMKKVEWGGKNFEGFVDFGPDTDEFVNLKKTNIPAEAGHAIVYMLVCINDNFKMPVAYYLIDQLNGQQKANLLQKILRYLHDRSVEVVSITFDGISSNFSMCAEMGANLKAKDLETTAFTLEHPVSREPITVFYDPSHALKLVRNTLGAKKIIRTHEGQLVKWEHIVSLADIQKEQGLYPGQKITKRHVEYKNEKMRVDLAAQVLSDGTADALNYLEFDLKGNMSEMFKGAEATATFCRNINSAFDLLNSKNLYNKNPSRNGISDKNIENVKEKVEALVRYIKGLEIEVPPKKQSSKTTSTKTSEFVCILETALKNGFQGLIMGLKNCVFLYLRLRSRAVISFLLTYKISQDHVETFFALVRRMFGCNNNPTTRKFKQALKKLMLHLNISVPLSANCTPRDDTLLLSVEPSIADETKTVEGSQAKYGKTDVDVDIPDDIATDFSEPMNMHDYSRPVMLNQYVDDVVEYLAGWVVRSVGSKIKCETCKKKLVAGEFKSPSLLIERKNRGGLTKPSKFVEIICKTAEKVIREYSHTLFALRNPLERLVVQSLNRLPSSVLRGDDHIFDQTPLFDHHNQLVRNILERYICVRFHHESAMLHVRDERIRMKMNKLTLFKHQ